MFVLASMPLATVVPTGAQEALALTVCTVEDLHIHPGCTMHPNYVFSHNVYHLLLITVVCTLSPCPPLPHPLPHPVGEEESNEPPKSLWKPPPVVPKEDNKTGANKKTYFVCNERTSYTS